MLHGAVVRPDRAILNAAVCAIALAATPALSVDRNGSFAVKGTGRVTCAALTEGDDAGRRDAAIWLTGYLTAHNRLMQDTFDLATWQSPSALFALAQQYCRANPDANLERAAAELVGFLARTRLKDQSEGVVFEHEGQVTVLYATVAEQAAQRLRNQGYEVGAAPGDFHVPLLAFQKDRGLPQTGIPDQRTLALLFQD